MAFIDIDRTYQSNKVPTQQDLDNIVDGVEAFLNVTGVSDDNIQDSSITASTKFIDASITQPKLGAGAVDSSQIQSLNASTDKFANDAVTTVKFDSASVTNVKLAANSISVANIVNGAVDPIHITPNKEQSTSPANMSDDATGNYFTVNTTTLTTNGGPVLLLLVPTITSSDPTFLYLNATLYGSFGGHLTRCRFLRDGSSLFTARAGGRTVSHAMTLVKGLPLNIGFFLDTPSAGSHTYTYQIGSTNGIGTAYNIKLVAWEL